MEFMKWLDRSHRPTYVHMVYLGIVVSNIKLSGIQMAQKSVTWKKRSMNACSCSACQGHARTNLPTFLFQFLPAVTLKKVFHPKYITLIKAFHPRTFNWLLDQLVFNFDSYQSNIILISLATQIFTFWKVNNTINWYVIWNSDIMTIYNFHLKHFFGMIYI
jgi:hypothetical protein